MKKTNCALGARAHTPHTPHARERPKGRSRAGMAWANQCAAHNARFVVVALLEGGSGP
jgi:hypothetical protein